MKGFRRWVGVALVVVAASGCSPDDTAAPEGCEGTVVEGTLPNGEQAPARSAVAARLADGAAYTIYLADDDLDLDEVSIFGGPERSDTPVWSVAVTTFDADPASLAAIEAGTVVEAGRPLGELTFTVGALAGDDFFGSMVDAAGTVTVDVVGSTVCGRIDYRDDEKSLRGTFEAPTRDL